MSELSGTAAVGIETVEWLDGGSGNLIVRVTGRWRRRRPASPAQVTLVIESEGRRHRFPAMPEPPSLGGAGPGMWRLSFSVPGSLAPALGGHIWLALGTAIVSLPTPGAGGRGSAESRNGDGAPIESARPPDEPPPADPVEELERQLAAEPAQPPARPAVTSPAPPAVTSPTPPAVTSRARDLEAARLRFERRLQARLAGAEARVPAEPRIPAASPSAPAPAIVLPDPPVSPVPLPVPASALVDTLRRELDARAAGEAALRSRLVAAETRLAARVLLDQRTTETLRQLRTELEGLRGALESERARREAAESRAAELEAERRARAQAERRAGQLERELGGQRERSRDAYDAIGELRGVLERLATPPPDAPLPPPDAPLPPPDAPLPPPDAQPPSPAAETGSPAAPGPVRPDRLSDALARLRESVPALDAVPETPGVVFISAGGRTLQAAFRRLVKRDADAAGELLLDLLVLQRAAYPHPIAYDLVLGPGRGCVRVTVGEGAPSIERQGAARTREEVDFRVRGEPARIARLLIAHGIWRRMGPRVARVRGRRDGLAALHALLALPLDLAALSEAGTTLRAEALLGLVAGMVDPAWTAGERFVIALRDPDGRVTYLAVRDGRALQILRTAPAGRVATTIDGSPDVLMAVLSGAAVPDGHVSGDAGPLESLRTWIKHAQSR